MTDLPEDVILSVEDLQTHFVFRGFVARSVEGVTFSLTRGKTAAIVGESGSGKSVTSLSIMRLLSSPGQIAGGRILYRARDGRVLDLARLSAREMRRIRGREIAMIFQEPMTSLNPLFTVGDQIGEMITLHQPVGRAEARRQVIELLDLVEIPAAATRLDDYPHQMSGGMRQRVMIALALACRPSLLIADEPTTALDVTVQAQILDLLRRLQSELGMSILFITHNLGVVAEIAHDVVVMYAGRVVEQASVRTLFAHQKHPYTKGLLASTPNPGRDLAGSERQRLTPIPGTVPSITALPPGCVFEPRCGYAIPECRAGRPPLFPAGPDHFSRCIRHEIM
ncbi:peptide/nickel transport system ATP-binding protein [Faunimonas pinastri]|uniref:Peptide/nickel transport system ATP-binding protein n=1 Tax=Faunimonas pinastri TaxID=1855383 RepID=A0A1H9LDC8_9HYPH|nr:ABC transporter ATP-binding protein [Faunimonas pinastri]SER09155.1 peptide/nickel transport system ATP-binding protein [Faunimonas pinastri]